MKLKIVVSDLCDVAEDVVAWLGSLDCDGTLMGKIVSSKTMKRKLARALRKTYAECGYAAIAKINKDYEEA